MDDGARPSYVPDASLEEIVTEDTGLIRSPLIRSPSFRMSEVAGPSSAPDVSPEQQEMTVYVNETTHETAHQNVRRLAKCCCFCVEYYPSPESMEIRHPTASANSEEIRDFGCVGCDKFQISGSIYYCIVCGDSHCEECNKYIKYLHHDDHPFYKFNRGGEDPSLVENPLEKNWPFEDDVIDKVQINNLFKFLCMVDAKFNYQPIFKNFAPGGINENEASQAGDANRGLSEIKNLFNEVKMDVLVDKIETLVSMFITRTYDQQTIQTYIKDANQQFAVILGKISEAIIRKTCKMRKCFKEINESNKLCECGHDSKTHREWKTNNEIKDIATTVVGNISFSNTDRDINMGQIKPMRSKKYLRIHEETTTELLSQTIKINWLECTNRYPNVLISLIGDTKNVEKDTKLTENLINWLMDAVLVMDAVVVTNGLHTGIAKLVGEAVQRVFYDPNARKVKDVEDGPEPLLIGVTSWMSVRDKEKLISTVTKNTG